MYLKLIAWAKNFWPISILGSNDKRLGFFLLAPLTVVMMIKVEAANTHSTSVFQALV